MVNSYNLQLHRLPIHVDGPDLEVHSDGGDVALSVGVILRRQVWGVINEPLHFHRVYGFFTYCKAEQQTRLSYSRVTDQKQFEQVVTGHTHTHTQRC